MKNADGRPRIHIWGKIDSGDRAGWAGHPAAQPTPALSPGAALDAAIDHLGNVNAVVIYEARKPQ